jgi:hypothetical protein
VEIEVGQRYERRKVSGVKARVRGPQAEVEAFSLVNGSEDLNIQVLAGPAIDVFGG